MSDQEIMKNSGLSERDTRRNTGIFHIFALLLAAVVVASGVFLSMYQPANSAPPAPMSLEQKMAQVQSGTPLSGQNAPLSIPRWMMALILGFTVIQIIPLVLAAHKSRLPELKNQDLRQIEFLTETPVFLGLLGTLLGVCLTQFISGTLAAPLAYLTTISGIVLYLFGRFTILLSVPASVQSTQE